PDGSGVSYETPVFVSGFPTGITITSPTDIQRVCMVIEHSFLGDMTISLSCPGGQEVVLFDGYNNGGGGTYLGGADDNSTGVPGVGAQYCFSTAAAWGTLLQEEAAGNYVTAGTPAGNSMTPGTYTSEQPFSNWNGCDLNGNWTITMTDNLAADDGYIFSWWLDIDPALYPNVITFTPVYDMTTASWSGPGVGTTDANGTATATPTAEGTASYVYTVTDDFGCSWDTTINVTVHPPLVQFVASSVGICDNAGATDLLPSLETTDGSDAPTTGDWTAPGGGSHSGTLDPIFDAAGTYTYTLGANSACESVGTLDVTIGVHVNAGNDQVLAYCSSDASDELFPRITGSPSSGGTWLAPDNSAFDGSLDPATDAAGIYKYVLVGTDPCPNDTAFLDITIPQAVDPGLDDAITLCTDAAAFSMEAELGGTPDAGGVWTATDVSVVPDSFDPATDASGIYTYTVAATLPCPDLSATLEVTVDRRPIAGTDASVVACANDADIDLLPLLGAGVDDQGQWYTPEWDNLSGTLDPSLEQNGTYIYVVNGPGTCAHLTDTAQVDVLVNPIPVIA
ncbi:MAG TPA: hypothetical protein VHL57_13045, partial [Flavobacteriales bacterium]|nr:hypothetical protein [Flavobacteriales bacterium]